MKFFGKKVLGELVEVFGFGGRKMVFIWEVGFGVRVLCRGIRCWVSDLSLVGWCWVKLVMYCINY